MLFFRSEEQVDDWCTRNGVGRGEVVPLAQVWRLAQAWYGVRLDPAYRGRTAEEVVAVFESVGLTSDFWKPAP